jgi:hypothetical protein
VANDDGANWFIDWSPDGHNLLTKVNRLGDVSLNLVRLDGSSSRPIVRSTIGHVEFESWLPIIELDWQWPPVGLFGITLCGVAAVVWKSRA